MQELLNISQNLTLQKSINEVIEDFISSFNSARTKNRYKTVLKQFFNSLDIKQLDEL
ncbi:MAG: Unknown protein [uncultured Campylobacterales bacterium]|uniref:Core-binding (CB) domain-containing protein n=1 Tax=uncultured Campylobacterales bacterium TaxID=352960 RepID=A0A6S6SVT2_9BACT|nr:MAG: Unknown protein [uncultured Campylobacterales bacterium]